jgi:hypothetical protein
VFVNVLGGLAHLPRAFPPPDPLGTPLSVILAYLVYGGLLGAFYRLK